jgi:hemerythrin-like domain-containing protein
MNQKQKVRMARKMCTPQEIHKHLPMFETDVGDQRKQGIAIRVRRQGDRSSASVAQPLHDRTLIDSDKAALLKERHTASIPTRINGMPQRKKAESNNAREQFESPMAMLKADHAKVKALFKKFESASDRMTKAKQQMVEEVLAALEVHAQIEEEIFYPAVKAIGEKESNKLIAESTEEHLVVQHLMQEMRGLAASDEQYAAKFVVLMENVRHHMEEEEGEMFPMAEEELDDELDELLAQMRERKQTLQTF